jgi:hypothetical protein
MATSRMLAHRVKLEASLPMDNSIPCLQLSYGKTERAWPVSIAESAYGFARETESAEQTAPEIAHAHYVTRAQTPPLMSPELLALERTIASVLAVRPECFITHPTEMAILKKLSPAELERFAAERGWRTVSRLGGRQIEFYNDAAARLAQEM